MFTNTVDSRYTDIHMYSPTTSTSSSTATAKTPIANILVVLGLVLAVLAVLPVTTNFLSDTKLYGIFLVGTLVPVWYGLKSLLRKRIAFNATTFTGPTFVLIGAVAASIFLSANYPVENLLGIGGSYLVFALLVLFGPSMLSKSSTKPIVSSFLAIMSVHAVVLILDFAGFGVAKVLGMIPNITFAPDFFLNLTGSHLVGAQLTFLGLLTLALFRKKGMLHKYFIWTAPLLAISLGLQVYALLPGRPTALTLPSTAASWSVALDTIRSPRQALIGVGPGGYLNAYNLFKPRWVNSTPEWSIEFTQASGLPLTVLTTMGFIGIFAWGVFLLQIVRHAKNATDTAQKLFQLVAACFALMIVLPYTPVLLFVAGILLILAIVTDSVERKTFTAYSIANKKTHNAVTVEGYAFYILVTSLLLTGIFGTYWVSRAYAAQVYSYQAVLAARGNDGARTYEMQQKAVQLNPYLDSLRRDYATTNLLIASALSNATDVTEAQQLQITQLIQQSIREGRAATTLDPVDTRNWITLASTYENLIGSTEEAAQLTIQTYTQAIQTSANNPVLLTRFGQVFLSQNQLEQAVSLFNQAIEIKPDYANAHYLLANALTAAQQPRQAEVAYQRLLTLLESGSEEYTQVTAELEAVQEIIAQLPEEETATGQTGTPTGTAPSLLEQSLETGALPVTPQETDLEVPTAQDQQDTQEESPEPVTQEEPEAN